jgi:hypothetical protein
MGMRKGGMTEEHKQKIREAQHQRKLNRETGVASSRKTKKSFAQVDGKPVLYLTGRERCANDMFNAIRNSLRPLGREIECQKLCMKIANLPIWNKPRELLPVLRETFEIKRAE